MISLCRDLGRVEGFEGFVVTDGYPLVVWLVMVLVGAFVGAVGSGTAASRFLDV